MRTKRQIKADPKASAEEIATLREEDQVLHPNCPSEVWWILVGDYPLEAMRSPLYALFLLEDPARWRQTELDRAGYWVANTWLNLSPGRAQVWVAECLEHQVLPVLQREYPDLAPLAQECITLRRLYVTDSAKGDAWLESKRACEEAWHALSTTRRANETNLSLILDITRGGQRALSDAIWTLVDGRMNTVEGKQLRLYQWERLKYYLRLEGLLP